MSIQLQLNKLIQSLWAVRCLFILVAEGSSLSCRRGRIMNNNEEALISLLILLQTHFRNNP